MEKPTVLKLLNCKTSCVYFYAFADYSGDLDYGQITTCIHIFVFLANKAVRGVLQSSILYSTYILWNAWGDQLCWFTILQTISSAWSSKIHFIGKHMKVRFANRLLRAFMKDLKFYQSFKFDWCSYSQIFRILWSWIILKCT